MFISDVNKWSINNWFADDLRSIEHRMLALSHDQEYAERLEIHHNIFIYSSDSYTPTRLLITVCYLLTFLKLHVYRILYIGMVPWQKFVPNFEQYEVSWKSN